MTRLPAAGRSLVQGLLEFGSGTRDGWWGDASKTLGLGLTSELFWEAVFVQLSASILTPFLNVSKNMLQALLGRGVAAASESPASWGR